MVIMMIFRTEGILPPLPRKYRIAASGVRGE
jgi:hypothetical protein